MGRHEKGRIGKFYKNSCKISSTKLAIRILVDFELMAKIFVCATPPCRKESNA